MKNKKKGIQIIFANNVSSTQDAIIPFLTKPHSQGVLLVAKTQNKGRGRGYNQWSSPEGGFWGTLGIKCHILPNICQFSLLHYSCTLFLKNLFHEKYHIQIQIKWPNDLYYKQKKLGGILIEFFQLNQHYYLLFGMGVNINNPSTSLGSHLRDHSISISEIIQKTINLDELYCLITKDILNYINPILKDDEEFISKLIFQYNKSILQKELILLEINRKKIKYKVDGITSNGFLKIKHQNIVQYLSIDDAIKIFDYK